MNETSRLEFSLGLILRVVPGTGFKPVELPAAESS